MKKKRKVTFWAVVAVLGIVNFFLYTTIAQLIGGVAEGEMTSEYAYYLSYKGNLTEVTPAIYWYSVVHTIITPILFLAAAFALVVHAVSMPDAAEKTPITKECQACDARIHTGPRPPHPS